MPRAPHPRPLRSLLGLPVASPRGQQTAANARHTFYLPKPGRKFEPFSLLSGRASGRQKVGLQGRLGMDSRDARGEEKPSLKRKITGEGRPLAAVSDPALGGFASAPDTAGRPPTDGPTAAHGAPGNAPNSRASTTPPDSPSPATAPWQRGATLPHQKDRVAGWLAGWQWGRFPQQRHIPGMFLINHDPRRHDRQKHYDSTRSHSSGLRIPG